MPWRHLGGGGGGYSSNLSWPWHYMGVSGQRHTLAMLYALEKGPPVPIG
jgi:hypothetical protein